MQVGAEVNVWNDFGGEVPAEVTSSTGSRHAQVHVRFDCSEKCGQNMSFDIDAKGDTHIVTIDKTGDAPKDTLIPIVSEYTTWVYTSANVTNRNDFYRLYLQASANVTVNAYTPDINGNLGNSEDKNRLVYTSVGLYFSQEYSGDGLQRKNVYENYSNTWGDDGFSSSSTEDGANGMFYTYTKTSFVKPNDIIKSMVSVDVSVDNYAVSGASEGSLRFVDIIAYADPTFYIAPDFQYIDSFELNQTEMTESDFLVDGSYPGVSSVPVPATVWLFFSSLIGLFGVRRFNR